MLEQHGYRPGQGRAEIPLWGDMRSISGVNKTPVVTEKESFMSQRLFYILVIYRSEDKPEGVLLWDHEVFIKRP